MAIERNVDIKFKVSGAAAASAQIDKVDTSLSGVDSAASGASKSISSVAVAQKSMASSMAGGIDKVDKMFASTDKLAGITSKLTNVVAIFSGVALLDMGKQLVDVGTKFADFVTGAEAARKKISEMEKGIRDSAAETEKFVGIVERFAGTKGLAGIFDVKAEDLESYLRLTKQLEGVKAGFVDALEASGKFDAEVAAANKRIFDAEVRINTVAAQGMSTEFAIKEWQEAESFLGELGQAADQNSVAIKLLADAMRALDAERRKLSEPASKAVKKTTGSAATRAKAVSAAPGGSSVQTFFLDEMSARIEQFNAATDAALDLSESTTGLMFDKNGIAGLFNDDAQAENAAKMREELDAMVATTHNLANAAGLVGSSLGTLSGAMKQAGVESVAFNRVLAAVEGAQMVARAAASYADGAKALAGGFLTPPNPVMAAANFIAAGAYTGAAVAFGAVAVGAGGGGGSSSSSGASVSPPSRSDFGSSSSGGDGGGDSYTINVSAGQSLSTSRDVERAVVGALESALRTRGSGARRRLATAGM